MRAHILVVALAAVCAAATPAGSVVEAVTSVVEVRSPGSTGTGFVIEGDRVVTAAHVVGSSPVTVAVGEVSRSATVIIHESTLDLAVLRLESGLDVRPLELSEDLPTPAEDVYAATAQPFGGTATVSRGIVSGVVVQDGRQVVQTDAAVNPGSSGGPLLREDGVVVGVTSSKLAGAEGVAFAIPTPVLIGILGQAGDGGAEGDGTSSSPTEREAAGPLPDRSPVALVRDWWPVIALAGVLLTAIVVGGTIERRRRRRPPPPGPFDIDVRLHGTRSPLQVPSDTHKDV